MSDDPFHLGQLEDLTIRSGTDTPETDAHCGPASLAEADHARKLERERNSLRDELKRVHRHFEDLEQSLVEVRDELENEGNTYRIIPLSHEDSGVVLAVCESIGPTLIPVTPWSGSMHLCPEQLDQLSDAMAGLLETKDQ